MSLEIRQLHPSLLPCPYVRTFDGYEASLLFFPAIAVSGSIVHMTGYNFVGSSCVEVPVAILSHALGFCFMRLLSVHVLILVCPLPPRCRVERQSCVVRFEHLPVLLFFPLRRTHTFFILCAFLLSMRTYVFLVCVALIGVPPSYSLPRLSRRTTAYDRGPTHITFCCLGLLLS